MTRSPNGKPARSVLALLLVLGVAACSADAPSPLTPESAAENRQGLRSPDPVQLTFWKTGGPGGVWEGTVHGDIEGDLRTELKDVHDLGTIWRVRFHWIISAGAQSFVADMVGTLNLETGRAEMRGFVIQGYLLGSRVEEEGQLINAETDGDGNLITTFQGIIRVFPRPALY